MKRFKKIICLGMTLFLTIAMMPVIVKAEQNNDNPLDSVVSQEIYEGYALEWEFCEGSLYDLLRTVKKEDTIIAEYEYNSLFQRTEKTVGEERTTITYTDDCYIDTVTLNDETYQYVYENEEGTNRLGMKGFIYNGCQYDFVYENHIITGLSFNGEVIAQYVYGDNYKFQETRKLVDGEWTECKDADFIGNKNKIRFTQMFYDDETGWYYTGRFYDPANLRYIDGIAPERAEELWDTYGYKAVLKSYRFALPYTDAEVHADFSARMSDLELVGRVIYAEAGPMVYDWTAVAWVVYNRMGNGKSAYDVVIEKDAFMAYWNDDYLFSTDSGYNQNKWNTCMANAAELLNYRTPISTVSYISTHKNFRRIDTFIAGYDSDGVTQYLNGAKIKNVAVPGIRPINPDVTYSDLVSMYGTSDGNFNFYFMYDYE